MQNIVSAIVLTLTSCSLSAQGVRPLLKAVYDVKSGAVKLDWTMVNAEGKTGYIILKSTDGINWFELVRDRILRNYTNEDVYSFEDINLHYLKNQYRLRIIDAFNTTVALSSIVVAGSGAVQGRSTEIDKNNWTIYPNPVSDVLTLNYRGSKVIQGCINVIILDINGKIVIRYRCASNTKLIQIPVGNIVRGSYFIQLSVSNEVLMKQNFIKQ